MEPPERSAQIAASLLNMALSLLRDADEPVAVERLQRAIEALRKPSAGRKKSRKNLL